MRTKPRFGRLWLGRLSETGAKIVAPGFTLGEGQEGVTEILDAIDITNRPRGAGARRNVVVKVEQVGESLRAEFNPVAHAVSF